MSKSIIKKNYIASLILKFNIKFIIKLSQNLRKEKLYYTFKSQVCAQNSWQNLRQRKINIVNLIFKFVIELSQNMRKKKLYREFNSQVYCRICYKIIAKFTQKKIIS